MIARFRMLECGKNFKRTMGENCVSCNVLDDEDHRLNQCSRFANHNFYNSSSKVDSKKIFFANITELRSIIPMISKVWNTNNSHGTMNIAESVQKFHNVIILIVHFHTAQNIIGCVFMIYY